MFIWVTNSGQYWNVGTFEEIGLHYNCKWHFSNVACRWSPLKVTVLYQFQWPWPNFMVTQEPKVKSRNKQESLSSLRMWFTRTKYSGFCSVAIIIIIVIHSWWFPVCIWNQFCFWSALSLPLMSPPFCICQCHWHHIIAEHVTNIMSLLHLPLTSSTCCNCH